MRHARHVFDAVTCMTIAPTCSSARDSLLDLQPLPQRATRQHDDNSSWQRYIHAGHAEQPAGTTAAVHNPAAFHSRSLSSQDMSNVAHLNEI